MKIKERTALAAPVIVNQETINIKILAAIDDISFVVTNVPNDVTGNWRIASIAENIEMQDYALDYYKEYFKSDD
ncbi:MAG: hypothetical protein MSS60_00560, partial [Clostridiales bacterium]|nr:hypothetical protein [Clostridiales bacterium]